MGLSHSNLSQPSDKALQLQQAAAPYDAVISAALQWAANWALPDCQVARVEDAAHGYQWQLWHTREDTTRFVDVTVVVYFGASPDKPKMFLVTFQTPSGWRRSIQCPLLREDLFLAVRRALTSN